MVIRFSRDLVCAGMVSLIVTSLSIAQSNTDPQRVLVKTQGSTEDDTVHQILQDKLGNLWIATSGEGVYRYDGTHFKQFTKNDGLNSNRIRSMLEDSAGSIWFGSDVGICRYDGKTITNIPLTGAMGRVYFPPLVASGNSPAAKNEVWCIMQDNSGILWFGTSGGVYRYHRNSFSRLLDNFQLINEEGLRLLKIQCMLQDSKGTIWLGSGLGEVEGLCRYDGKHITSIKPKPDGWIRNISEDRSGTIWISTRHRGVWRDEGNGFEKFPKDEPVSALLRDNLDILQDHTGDLWFSGSEELDTLKSHSGIWRFDGTQFRNYNSNDGLGAFSVFSLFEDREGRIWVGTRNTGLYRFDGTKFTSFSE